MRLHLREVRWQFTVPEAEKLLQQGSLQTPHPAGVHRLGYLSYLISSKISGFSRSLFFIRSFMAVMMLFALSSAPCFELFSAAPRERESDHLYVSFAPNTFVNRSTQRGRGEAGLFGPNILLLHLKNIASKQECENPI
jgi:hypothetical protein